MCSVKFPNDAPPEVRSRFERTLIRCPVCGTPIGYRQGNKWWFMNRTGGGVSKTPVTMNQSTPQGDYRVGCPRESCEGGHIFAWVNEVIAVTDGVDISG